MNQSSTRREFLHQVAGGGVLAAGLPRALGAADPSPNVPRVADHELTVISGKPRERASNMARSSRTPFAHSSTRRSPDLRRRPRATSCCATLASAPRRSRSIPR